MGAEKELDPGGHAEGGSYIVQATDKMGRTVSRDPFESEEEAQAHAVELRQAGHTVEVSPLPPVGEAR